MRELVASGPSDLQSATEGAPDAKTVEDALAAALGRASEAGRWDVVVQLARELEARRLAGAGNVVRFEGSRGKDDAK